ncbi:head completion/stabilization protein [Pararhodospirillum photometricum]|nr:head completion/stabilization protein [Pararhodospirillum photometricum]
MTPTLIPSGGLPATEAVVANDGWYPDIPVSSFKLVTGLDDTFRLEQVVETVTAAVAETNRTLLSWRQTQTASSLAEVPGPLLNGRPGPLALYRTAVHALARAKLLQVVRDFDSTKSGHARADALESTADDWLARAHEALSVLTGRPRATIELV